LWYQMAELPPPPEGIVLAHFIVSDDVGGDEFVLLVRRWIRRP